VRTGVVQAIDRLLSGSAAAAFSVSRTPSLNLGFARRFANLFRVRPVHSMHGRLPLRLSNQGCEPALSPVERRSWEELMRTILTGAAVASALLIGSAALAQQTGGAGTTTGPAAGTNVQPSTATQKQNDSAGGSASSAPSAAGGAAGVEGKPGNKSGRSEKKPQ
jgi:uncharacterized low-complexity protein